MFSNNQETREKSKDINIFLLFFVLIKEQQEKIVSKNDPVQQGYHIYT